MNYNDMNYNDLMQIAQRHFNAYIRKRDEGKPCINCNQFKRLQAGHYFSVGGHGSVRFDENNCHGECKQCNYYNSQSHAYKYRNNLIAKIGLKEFEQLELKSKFVKKWSRYELIQIIETYKEKYANL